MKEFHPLTQLIPERAVQGDIETSIAQDGFTEPVVLYEGKVIEGRVRYRAGLALGGANPDGPIRVTFRDWVLLGEKEPLDWMVKRHVATHELSELDRIRLVAAVLAPYREMKGATNKRLYQATKLPWNQIRAMLWLDDAGALQPVIDGELSVFEAARRFGFTGDKKTVAIGANYGAGDKFDEAFTPIKRYLAAWKRKGYEFRHVNPKEAARRVLLIESLLEELQAAKPDLERRAVKSTYSLPPERNR